MGNRKKSKVEKMEVLLKGNLGPNLGLPDTDRVMVEEFGIAMAINAPKADKVVYKEVPAKVDGVDIGTAIIYEDGTVDVQINDDAPEWAKDKINMTAGEFGYTIGEKLE